MRDDNDCGTRRAMEGKERIGRQAHKKADTGATYAVSSKGHMISILLAATLAISKPQQAKTQVMILGVYHFANPKADLIKTELDDHMSDKRQKEIADVVERLEKFKPTKIMVERTADDGANDRYHQYLAGNYKLSVNELDQLGMRMAKNLGHKDIYAVDWRNGMNFDPVIAFAQKNDPQFMKFFGDKIAEVTKALSDLPIHTVRENLSFFNKPETLRDALTPYLRMLSLNDGKEFPGADLVAGWYSRNIHIYGIMAKQVEPTDRVLVIFGSGHAPILRHLVEMSDNMQLVEPNDYLG